MENRPKDDMSHEDNSTTTKIGVVFGFLLITGVILGCLFMVWLIIKLFIYWN